MFTDIYSPLSLVAENANTDSTISLIMKEESITNSILKVESDIMKEYYAIKKREWKTILESGGNQDIITEGVLSSIGEFISNLFTRLVEFIRDLFGKNENTSKSIEDKKKVAETLTTQLAASPTPTEVILQAPAPDATPAAGETATPPAPAPEHIKGFRNIATCIISDESAGLIKIENMIKLMREMEDTIDKVSGKSQESFKNLMNSADLFVDSFIDCFPKKIQDELEKQSGETEENRKLPDTNRVAQLVFNFKQNEFISIADMKALMDKTSVKDINASLKHSKDLHNTIEVHHKQLTYKLKKLSEKSAKINTANMSEEEKSAVAATKIAIDGIKKTVAMFVKLAISIEGAVSRCIATYDNMLSRYNRLLGGKPDSRDLNESCIIHGEVIDSNSIFDNGDDDFNNTEWIDLALKEAYKMEKRKEEIDAQRYLNECIMLASDITRREKISAIRSLTEAEAKQSKNLITRAIEGIKRIFQKFLEKLRSVGKDNTKYLLKYKKVILENKPMAQKVKMKDCFTGIKRLANAKIGQFNYDAIKGSMETPEAAQEWLKKQIPTVNDDVLNNIKEFRTWCLAYFCVAPESPLKEFEMSNPADVNMTDVYNFMFDIKKIETQLSTDQKALESTAISFANAADKISKETATTAPVQPVQASAAWSVVYGKVLTERVIHELEVVNDTKADANTTDPSRASSNMANSTEDAPDAEKTLRAGTAAGNNAELQKVKLHTDNYMAAIRVFFTAKLTATEIIQSELMKLIRLHVQNFVKDETQGTTGKATGTKYGDGAQPATAK